MSPPTPIPPAVTMAPVFVLVEAVALLDVIIPLTPIAPVFVNVPEKVDVFVVMPLRVAPGSVAFVIGPVMPPPASGR